MRLDHGEQVVGVVRLVEHELHLRALGGEPGEDAREDLGADALHQADPQPAALAPRHLLHLGGGHAERGEHGAGVLEEQGAAVVSRTGRGPPGRSNIGVPATRSRAAICWLTADCV